MICAFSARTPERHLNMILAYENFSTLFDENGLKLTPVLYEKLDRYASLLIEWNEKINLTAITDAEGISIKHFLDSLMLLSYIELSQGARVIDVGTGAGFPGIPLKLYREDIQLTLLDSLQKRIRFLNELSTQLEFDVESVHARAEDGARTGLREAFDLATARAVAPLPVLCEYCLPYVKVGGFFAALKGPSEDVHDAEDAISLLGGEISQIKYYSIPNGDARMLVLIKKISQTPTKYPRNSGQIAKKSL